MSSIWLGADGIEEALEREGMSQGKHGKKISPISFFFQLVLLLISFFSQLFLLVGG